MRYSILVVDDDQTTRDFLGQVVRLLGHRCITGTDGVDALEKLAKSPFDILITDIDMPRMNGIDSIKCVATDFEKVDVIVISGQLDKYRPTDIVALGARDLISKPFTIEELNRKITHIVQKRRQSLN